MREIVTAVEMKELDHNTIQKAGISSPVLMERAALKTVEEIVQRLKNKEKEKILTAALRGGLVDSLYIDEPHRNTNDKFRAESLIL